jgi:hypothetical protein
MRFGSLMLPLTLLLVMAPIVGADVARGVALDPIRIPFRWTPGQIEIQVSIDGRNPIWCILDSGAEISMLDYETAEMLGLGPSHKQGGRDHIGNLTLQIGALKLLRQTVTLWKLDNFRRQKREIRGVIGCVLFERYAVTIDYEKHVIVLREPATFRPAPGASSFALTFSGRLPVIEAVLKAGQRSIPARLMVDTGAAQAAVLRYPFATRHELFGRDDPRKQSETVAAGGRAFITLAAHELTLGRWAFQKLSMLAYGSAAGAGGYTETDGVLGNDVLRRFRVVTFDYSRKRLFVEDAPQSH